MHRVRPIKAVRHIAMFREWLSRIVKGSQGHRRLRRRQVLINKYAKRTHGNSDSVILSENYNLDEKLE